MSKHDIAINVSTERKVFLGIGLLTVLALVGGIWLISASDNKQKEKLSKPLMGEEVASQGEPHIKRGESHPSYSSNPPTSGWHWGDGTAGPGIKDSQVPNELVLHSMEHGAVVVWFKADLPKEDVEKITQAFNDVTGKKIMMPRQDLDTPVALTSWGRLLKLESIDETKIREFITTNEDRGPEKAAI